jgi:RimJ/RimL family protein N-acetyltransferase
MKRVEASETRIEPWSKGDLHLLEKSLGDPQMTAYVGGPESPEKIAERQSRYEQPNSRQFKIIDGSSGQPAGWVGYWIRTWHGEQVFEIGWSVIPEFQGRGLASAGTRLLLDKAREEGTLRFVHAYPSVINTPSNAICRKVGFTLQGEVEFEYPPGNLMRCNDWRFDLFEGGAG